MPLALHEATKPGEAFIPGRIAGGPTPSGQRFKAPHTILGQATSCPGLTLPAHPITKWEAVIPKDGGNEAMAFALDEPLQAREGLSPGRGAC